MFIISLYLMWLIVWLFDHFDGEVSFDIPLDSRIVWSVINAACYALLWDFTHSRGLALLATVYLVAAAVMDYYSGYVYSNFSAIVLLFLLLIFLMTGNPGNFPEPVMIYFYIKALELSGVYCGGDTDYLFVISVFLVLTTGKMAAALTVYILLFAVGLHTIIYWRSKNKKEPFTPQLLAGTVLMLTIF